MNSNFASTNVPAGISTRQVDLFSEMAAFDSLHPVLREALNYFPFDMSSEQVAEAIAKRNWLPNAVYEKIIEQQRATPLGHAVDRHGVVYNV